MIDRLERNPQPLVQDAVRGVLRVHHVAVDEDQHVAPGVSEHHALRPHVAARVVVARTRDHRPHTEVGEGLLDRADAVHAQLVARDGQHRRGRSAGTLRRARGAGDDALVEQLLEVAQ